MICQCNGQHEKCEVIQTIKAELADFQAEHEMLVWQVKTLEKLVDSWMQSYDELKEKYEPSKFINCSSKTPPTPGKE